ncbi:MAG: hypothetical protein Q9200_005800 [Gallowayella weberi]
MQTDTHRSQAGRTRASHALQGGPPSRAKDHSCLELVVTLFTAHVISRTSMTVTKVIVAPRDFVTLRRTSTYGCPVGELIALSRSPRQNTSFITAVAIIERGKIQEAFFNSSAKWTLESAPITSPIAALIPTRDATPGLDQPFDENVVKTEESLLGAITLPSQYVPKNDDECTKSEDMSKDKDYLQQGQFPKHDGIEKDGCDNDGPSEQGSLPSVERVI